MRKHLTRRSDGRSQYYYVRLTAPTEIHHLLPRAEREIRRSTGTADLHKAKAVAAKLEAKYRESWEQLRASLRNNDVDATRQTIGLTDSLIRQICGARLASWSLTDDLERVSEGLSTEDLEQIDEFCRLSDGAMRSILAQGKHSASWDHVIEQVLEWCIDLGYNVETSDPLFPQLVRQFADTEKTASQIISARNQGENPVFPVIEQEKPRLSAMVEQYTKHRESKIGRKTFTTNLSIWKRFVEFCGDIPLDSVTSGTIYGFLDDRLHTENEPWSQNYALGRGKITLKEFFSLARTLSMMDTPNPVLGMELSPSLNKDEAKKRTKPRFPFSSEQLNQLFRSEWYNPDATKWTGKMKTDLGARYWAPLFCMHHGLRVREVVQLHTSDFRYSGTTLLMTIQVELDDAESSNVPARSLKNESTKRTVPVHPRILEQGFAEFLHSIKEYCGSNSPLFPSAIPNPDSENPLWGRAYEQALLRFVTQTLGFGKGYGNHSFRHTVEDTIRDSQAEHGLWPAGLAQFYTGRKLPRDSDKIFFRLQGSEIDYGKGFNPAQIISYVEKIAYPEVTLPVPFAEWLGGKDPLAPWRGQQRKR